MSKFSFFSLFSSKKNATVADSIPETEEMVQKKLEVLRWIAMTSFSNNYDLEVYKGNPVIVCEDVVITRSSGERDESKNVFFFENDKPSISYDRVACVFDVDADAAELLRFIEESRQWGRRVTHTWNADGLLAEIDFASAEKSWSNDKFTYGPEQLITQRFNIGDWEEQGIDALFTHLPEGKGFGFRYSDDAGTGEDQRAYIENGKVVIHFHLVDGGRVITDKKYYYTTENVVIKEEFMEAGKVVRTIDYTLDKAGNVVLKEDSEYGAYKTAYGYDEKGNYTWRKMENGNGYVEEVKRVIRY